MPIILCPDCGAEVSDRAPACIKCGRPLATGTTPKPPGTAFATEAGPEISPVRVLLGVVAAFALAAGWFWVSTERSSAASRERIEVATPAPTRGPSLYQLGLERILVSDFSWSKGGFGTVAMVKLEIRNANPYAVKDLHVRCDVTAASGTMMGSVEHTLFERVKATSTRVLPEANFGLINSQAKSLSCRVVGYTKAE